MTVGYRQLLTLTGAKLSSNISLRWVPFFLVALSEVFDASVAVMATIIGVSEMAGLTTLFVRKRLDSGGERQLIVMSLVVSAAAAGVALAGSLVGFSLGFLLLMIANAHITVGAHTWLGSRVPYERRGRFIGIFETSWALGLLVGAPLMALVISLFGWRAAFVVVAVLSLVAALPTFALSEIPRQESTAGTPATLALTKIARLSIGVSATIALAGLTTIVIVGTWLSDQLGVSTGGIGLVAMAFGFVELVSAASSAAFSDRLGKRRTMIWAASSVLLGLVIVNGAGTSLMVGVIGLAVFFYGFEYGIVTSFSIVSESMPEARGRAIATNSAVGTMVRGAGAITSGILYENFGIAGPTALSGAAGATCLVLLGLLGREREKESGA